VVPRDAGPAEIEAKRLEMEAMLNRLRKTNDVPECAS